MDLVARVTQKPINQIQQMQRRQQQLLNCPRCESTNTKFCYYNNYSLSQPRHFCKACKRYWTRGGTLRNVPIGGGCKKNKIKKTFTSSVDHNPNPHHSIPSKDTRNPLYDSTQRNPNHQSFNTRVFDMGDSKNDLIHTKMNSFAIEISPLEGDHVLVDNHAHDSMYPVASYLPMFNDGFTSCRNSSDHTMAYVLTSGIQEHPRFLGSTLYGDGGGSVVNDVRIGGTKISMDYSNNDLNGQNDDDIDQIKMEESSDPTSFLWKIPGGDEGGEWIDPTSSIIP